MHNVYLCQKMNYPQKITFYELEDKNYRVEARNLIELLFYKSL